MKAIVVTIYVVSYIFPSKPVPLYFLKCVAYIEAAVFFVNVLFRAKFQSMDSGTRLPAKGATDANTSGFFTFPRPEFNGRCLGPGFDDKNNKTKLKLDFAHPSNPGIFVGSICK